MYYISWIQYIYWNCKMRIIVDFTRPQLNWGKALKRESPIVCQILVLPTTGSSHAGSRVGVQTNLYSTATAARIGCFFAKSCNLLTSRPPPLAIERKQLPPVWNSQGGSLNWKLSAPQGLSSCFPLNWTSGSVPEKNCPRQSSLVFYSERMDTGRVSLDTEGERKFSQDTSGALRR